MKIYGFEENADVRLRLSEVSFAATPDEIRCLARFLQETAATMEKHGEDFGHEHFRNYCRESEIACVDGTADVIVARLLASGPS